MRNAILWKKKDNSRHLKEFVNKLSPIVNKTCRNDRSNSHITPLWICRHVIPIPLKYCAPMELQSPRLTGSANTVIVEVVALIGRRHRVAIQVGSVELSVFDVVFRHYAAILLALTI